MIRNVLFDFDHTLVLDHHLEENVLADLAGGFCKLGASGPECLDAIKDFRSGRRSLHDSIVSALRAWGYPEDQMEDLVVRFREECLKRAKDVVTPVPGALEMLHALSENGIAAAILSNGWTALQHAKVEAIGFRGPVITSEEIGAWKPDPKAFEIALAKLNFEKPSTMYVGDSPETDIAGAKNVGLRAIWVNLDDASYPEGLVRPDFVIRALTELPPLLNSLT